MRKNVISLFLACALITSLVCPTCSSTYAKASSINSSKEYQNDDPEYYRQFTSGAASTDTASTESNKISLFSSLKQSSTTVNPYTKATYTHADAFDGMKIYNGVDVSYHRGKIDWNKVKAAGIDFAIIRMGYRGYSAGTLATDSMFAANMQGAIAAGINVGAYFFTEAQTVDEATAEANYMAAALKPYNINMPVAFDWELNTSKGASADRKYGLTKTENTKICTAFCDVISSYGYTPMVYANKSDLTTNLDGSGLAKKYTIWLAHYTTKTDYANPYTFWQYSAESAKNPGTVDGISGVVDLNYWYSTSGAAISVNPVQNVKATPKAKKVKLSWTKSSNADGYSIYRKDTYDGTYELIKTITDASTTSFTNSGLAAGREYYYKIKAYKSSDSGKVYSKVVSVTANTKPSAVKVFVTDSALTIVKKPGAETKVVSVKKKASLVNVATATLNDNTKYYHVNFVTTAKTYSGYVEASQGKLYKSRTTKVKLALRKKAGAKGKLVYNIPKKTVIAVLGTKKVSKKTWYKTSYSGKKGKVYNGYVLGSLTK